jgi:hypothetical protein
LEAPLLPASFHELALEPVFQELPLGAPLVPADHELEALADQLFAV